MDKFPFIDVWNRIVVLTGWQNYVQLAEFLGFSSSSISGAKNRGFFPIEWAYNVAHHYNGVTDWLLTGEGPIYKGEADKREEGKITAPAPWQPAPPRVDNSQPAPDATFDTLDVVEGMTMLTRIYGSGDTTYIRAINANLMAFSDAITAKTTNQTMQGQLNKLEDRLATLEQSLESPPKAANGD